METTIVAISTPPGKGGVGIVRVSGSLALSLAQTISHLSDFVPRNAYHATFYDQDAVPIDAGLIIYFQAPHSFTGEDVVEFHCHGSPVVLDILLHTCINLSARLARPGEFSERAFLNDKIDLVQAEAIADLINAHSTTAARMAVRSLQGNFSQRIAEINHELIGLRLYVEAAIDFPEEEIDFLNDKTIITRLHTVQQQIASLCMMTHQGVIMSEGLTVVITGRPNVGKSTLINCLAQNDVAIVTPIAGTTRDIVRAHIMLDDIAVHVIDTAGLHDSEDIVEQEGIKRAWHEICTADCILLVIDVTEPLDQLNQEIIAKIPQGTPILYIFNKIDKLSYIDENSQDKLYISAQLGLGITELKAKIKSVVGYQPTEGMFLARRRHLDALNQANTLLLAGISQLTTHKAGELLAEDLRVAHLALTTITGEFSSDDLLGEIFSNFCIGK